MAEAGRSPWSGGCAIPGSRPPVTPCPSCGNNIEHRAEGPTCRARDLWPDDAGLRHALSKAQDAQESDAIAKPGDIKASASLSRPKATV